MAHGTAVEPRGPVTQRLRAVLERWGMPYEEGAVWSTDGIYRETPGKVYHFRKRGSLAVEMEVSSLFSVGRYHDLDVGALLVVSDELYGEKWRPGFKDDRFRRTRRALCDGVAELCSQK
jgi:purine-nucleoside phosphorylase